MHWRHGGKAGLVPGCVCSRLKSVTAGQAHAVYVFVCVCVLLMDGARPLTTAALLRVAAASVSAW